MQLGFLKLVLRTPRWWGEVLPTGPTRESDRPATGQWQARAHRPQWVTDMGQRWHAVTSVCSPGLLKLYFREGGNYVGTGCSSEEKCVMERGQKDIEENKTNKAFYSLQTVSCREKDDNRRSLLILRHCWHHVPIYYLCVSWKTEMLLASIFSLMKMLFVHDFVCGHRKTLCGNKRTALELASFWPNEGGRDKLWMQHRHKNSLLENS